MTNYARISRNDDETFSDEAEFVAKRRDELIYEWLHDSAKVKEAIAVALSDDGEDYFAGKVAEFFVARNAAESIQAELTASYAFKHSISWFIHEVIERDAETAAQAAWDSRLTGPEGDL